MKLRTYVAVIAISSFCMILESVGAFFTSLLARLSKSFQARALRFILLLRYIHAMCMHADAHLVIFRIIFSCSSCRKLMRARCSKFVPRIYFAITRFAPWLCGASLKLLALTTPGITPWHWWMKHRYQMPSGGSHSLKMEGIWHSRRSLCSSHPLSTRMGVVHASTTSGVR